MRPTIAVLGDGVMAMQIQRDDQGARAVWCGQWLRLPAARAQAQRGVLKLGLRRRSAAASLPSTWV